MVIERVHSFQSSSIQEPYLKGVVHHWLMEEYVHSNPLVFKNYILKGLYIIGLILEEYINSNPLVLKKHIIKGWYIIGYWKSTFIQIVYSYQSNIGLIIKGWYIIGYWKSTLISIFYFQETYHKGMLHHWLLEEYIHSNRLQLSK